MKPEEQKNPYPKTLAATKTASILAIVAGLPLDANGHYLSDAQMANIESALAAGEKAAADLATAQGALQTAQEATVAAEGKLKTANEQIAKLEGEDATPTTTATAPKETVHVVAQDDPNEMAFQKELYAKV